MWYTPIAVGTVIIVGIVVSYLTHPLKYYEVNPLLIIRMNDIFEPIYEPSYWRNWLPSTKFKIRL